MENNIVEKSFTEKLFYQIKNKKKTLIFIISFLTLIAIIFVSYKLYEKNENNMLSEKFIKAGIMLSLDDKQKSKELYKEIIIAKSKFYSILSLNNILEHNLIENTAEVIELFNKIEDIKTSKENMELIKLKKALYYKKIFDDKKGNELLEEIVSEGSIWKDAAIEALTNR